VSGSCDPANSAKFTIRARDSRARSSRLSAWKSQAGEHRESGSLRRGHWVKQWSGIACGAGCARQSG
jgi:hypothetical protein